MLLVIGDSHSLIWGGRLLAETPAESRFPLVKIQHIHDPLAYNLMDDDGIGKWGRTVLTLLSAHGADMSAIMLSFGEIDIRTQVIRRALAQNISIEEAVAPIVSRYMQFVDILRQKTPVPIFIWGPVPSASDFGDWNPNYPNSGSEQDRNLATQSFNSQLKRAAKKGRGIYAFDLFDQLTDSNWRTHKQFFPDGCHLGHEALEMITEAFTKTARQHKLDLPDYFAAPFFMARKKAEIRDISAAARITAISSVMEGEQPVTVDNPGDKLHYVFHTDKDDVPFVRLDIGYGAFLDRLIIYNRFDAYKERARTIEIWVGKDLKDLHPAYKHAGELFGLNYEPLNIKIDFPDPIRFIVMKLGEREYFHLGKITILAKCFI